MKSKTRKAAGKASLDPLVRCGYCGSATHDRRDCPRELKATGRWSQAEWDALQRLCELEHDCMRYGMHITECPMAVSEYAKLGRTFTPNAPAEARCQASPPAGCSVSFSPADIDAYIAATPYTESGIECEAPMHDREDLMDFYEWLKKSNTAI